MNNFLCIRRRRSESEETLGKNLFDDLQSNKKSFETLLIDCSNYFNLMHAINISKNITFIKKTL